MPLEDQKYYQKLNSVNKQVTEIDRKIISRNKFNTRTRKLWFINEGFSAWRIKNFEGLFEDAAYTLCPFDTQTFESSGINIYKDPLHKFRVGKTGLYEVNVNWLVGLSDSFATKTEFARLYLGKNGVIDLNDEDNFLFLDYINMWTNCIGPSGCEDYFGVIALQGTKYIWLEKDSDYIELRLYHSSTLDITVGDTHSGFIEINYETNKTKVK